MVQLSPKEIVGKALEKDELDLLLLGRPEYRCFSLLSALRSSLPYDNDLGKLLDVLHEYGGEYTRDDIAGRLLRAMKKISES